jgi:hypothetical protein
MRSSFKIGEVIQFRGIELLAIKSGFALLDENRFFIHGKTVEALPCLKRVKHHIQVVNNPRHVFQEGVVVDTLPIQTMEKMLDKTITLIK